MTLPQVLRGVRTARPFGFAMSRLRSKKGPCARLCYKCRTTDEAIESAGPRASRGRGRAAVGVRRTREGRVGGWRRVVRYTGIPDSGIACRRPAASQWRAEAAPGTRRGEAKNGATRSRQPRQHSTPTPGLWRWRGIERPLSPAPTPPARNFRQRLCQPRLKSRSDRATPSPTPRPRAAADSNNSNNPGSE